MRYPLPAAALIAAAMLPLAAVAAPLQPALSADDSRRIGGLIARMTIDEKVGQLNQVAGADATGPVSPAKAQDLAAAVRSGRIGSMLNIRGAAATRQYQEWAMRSRLKIPLLFALDVIHGYQTVFPVPLGETASWDLGLIEQSARIAAIEASASGIHWTFAPMVDVARDPRWGRVMEGAGEDPWLGAAVARARVLGFQKRRLGDTDAVMATAKHFAGYGAALAGRDYNTVDMSMQQLHEVYLPPFKAAADAGVASFMNAFNTLNGVPATGSSYLQTTLLRRQWGYGGIVVSDWASVGEMIPHGFARDDAHAARLAINAGNDIDMESHVYDKALAGAVRSGAVATPTLDAAVRRVLEMKARLGLFKDPYRFSDARREREALSNPAHRVAALEAARKSAVLLKNENRLLPIQPGARHIAVIGPLASARRDLEGGWLVNSSPQHIVSIADAIKARAPAGTLVTVLDGCDVACAGDTGFAAAEAAARQADLVVLAVGEGWDMTGEDRSRVDIGLPGRQNELVQRVARAGKPVAAVVLGGRPLILNTLADHAGAILMAWLPGSEGGNAIGDVLFGHVNPSAKLPITFPRSVGQIPISYAHYMTGRPAGPERAPYRSQYIDSPNTPLYAFGHGLSYTTFGYTAPAISAAQIKADGKATLRFTLTNSGAVYGEEVVQLYVHDEVASLARPVKLLRGFRKVGLQPGASTQVEFTIDRATLSFVDASLASVVEPGSFKLMVGSASDDVRFEALLEVLP